MTLFVDELRTVPGGQQRCRLVGTSLAELDDFANLVLRQPVDYRQSGPPTHYSLTPAMRTLALRKGACEITTSQIAARLKASKSFKDNE